MLHHLLPGLPWPGTSPPSSSAMSLSDGIWSLLLSGGDSGGNGGGGLGGGRFGSLGGGLGGIGGGSVGHSPLRPLFLPLG